MAKTHINETDEVADAVQGAFESFKRHMVTVIIVAALVIILSIASVVWGTRRQNAREDASRKISLANAVFARLPAYEDEQTRTNELQNILNTLGEVIEDHAGSPASRLALYLQGNCYYYMDELDKAEEVYQRYVDETADTDDQARGEIALGYTLENKFYLQEEAPALLDDADAHFSRAAALAEPESYLYYQALLNRARVLEIRSLDEEALTLYDLIIEGRTLPRKSAKDEEDVDPIEVASLAAFITGEIDRAMAPLSYQATAKLRADRLRATSEVLTPEDRGE